MSFDLYLVTFRNGGKALLSAHDSMPPAAPTFAMHAGVICVLG